MAECEVAVTPPPQAGSRDESWCSAQFLCFSQSGTPGHGMELTIVKMDLSTSITPTKIINQSLIGMPRALSVR